LKFVRKKKREHLDEKRSKERSLSSAEYMELGFVKLRLFIKTFYSFKIIQN